MTEQQWLTCPEPDLMLTYLRPRMPERKLLLFACACCWRLQPLLDHESQQLLSVVERSADIRPSAAEINAVRDDAMGSADALSYRMGHPDGCARWLAAEAV